MTVNKMINLKKINIELILTTIFFFLMFYVSIQYMYPILKNLNFFSSLVQFEVSSTWGTQLVITQEIVVFFIVLFIVIIAGLRIRHIRNH